MLRSRSIPMDYFRHPDGISCSSGEVRCVLVSLVLQADEHGRGLNCPPATMEAALVERGQAELVQCSQVGKHARSIHTRWDDWQQLTKRAHRTIQRRRHGRDRHE